jgi:hypothetical protein
MDMLEKIYKAIHTVLATRRFFLLCVILAVLIFGFMFFFPIESVPGNDIRLQTSLYGAWDYAALVTLSILSSLVLTMQVYVLREGMDTPAAHVRTTAVGGVGVASGLVSSLFATASCTLCAGALFSFLGFGTVLFLVEYRWYVVVFSILLLCVSIYLLARRITEGCAVCTVSG